MMIVSEHDIERLVWTNSDKGGAMARESGAKTYNTPHPHLDQFL